MNKHFLVIFSFIFFILLPVSGTEEVGFNPWELIIYRPDDNYDMNNIWCWLKLEDDEGNDVTYSAAKAQYEYVAANHNRFYYIAGDTTGITKQKFPDKVYNYQKTYYLAGGMAMYLNLKPGKYKISFYTPVEKQNLFECENKNQWESNVFYYDTSNPLKVLFVTPTADDNGFYNGGWWLDYHAPKYFKNFSVPKQVK